MTLPDALEQVMWDNPSIGIVPGRWATRDTVLGGQHIKEGDMLLLCISAANVDPEQRPDLSVPMRGNRSHLALSSGPHECPGGDIGRAIADTGIDELVALLPDLTLAVPETEIGITANWLTSRPSALPVRFTRPRSLGGTAVTMPEPATGAQPLPVAASAPPAPPPHVPSIPKQSWWRSLLRL